MGVLKEDFEVEVTGDNGKPKKFGVGIIADQNWNLRHHTELKLPSVGEYSITCVTGIDRGFGVRRIIVTSPDERKLTGQFNSWRAEVGTDIVQCPEDIRAADAVAKTLIQRLEHN